MFLGLHHFFVMNRIKLDWEIIRKMYPLKTRPIELKAWQKQDIKKLIDTTCNKRDAVLFYFLASTGARIGVFDPDSASDLLDAKREERICTELQLGLCKSRFIC